MLQVAFNIGRPEDLIDWTIAICTQSYCKHSELYFSNGQSFSSDPGYGGTHFTVRDYSDPNKWELVALPWITSDMEADIYRFCNQELGCRYDWKAVLLGWLITPCNSINDWFCTELCLAALRPYLKWTVDRWYTPIQFMEALEMENRYRTILS